MSRKRPGALARPSTRLMPGNILIHLLLQDRQRDIAIAQHDIVEFPDIEPVTESGFCPFPQLKNFHVMSILRFIIEGASIDCLHLL